MKRSYKGAIKVGERFEYLEVIATSEVRDVVGCVQFLCRCDCGKEKLVSGFKLKNGKMSSCGCRRWTPETKAKRVRGLRNKLARQGRLDVERRIDSILDGEEAEA